MEEGMLQSLLQFVPLNHMAGLLILGLGGDLESQKSLPLVWGLWSPQQLLFGWPLGLHHQ